MTCSSLHRRVPPFVSSKSTFPTPGRYAGKAAPLDKPPRKTYFRGMRAVIIGPKYAQ